MREYLVDLFTKAIADDRAVDHPDDIEMARGDAVACVEALLLESATFEVQPGSLFAASLSGPGRYLVVKDPT